MRRAVRWAIAAAVVGAAVVALSWEGGAAIELRGVVVGSSATFEIGDPPAWMPAWARRSVVVRSAFQRETRFDVATPAEGDALFLHFTHSVGHPGTAVVAGRCGCVWSTSSFLAPGWPCDAVVTFPRFPRRSAEWQIQGAHHFTIANPAPLPPATTQEVADELPVSTQVGDETWVLSRAPDPHLLTIRAIDANRSGFAWTYRVAVLSDASGNRVLRRPPVEPEREQRIWLPTGDPYYHLCPHEPWWELTIDVREGKTVTFRFRP
jgi:hypothetical protein